MTIQLRGFRWASEGKYDKKDQDHNTCIYQMIGIGYDIGSSFIKAALVEVQTGNAIARARVPEVEIAMESKQAGWAEQDPNIWWEYLCKATQKLLAEAQIKADQISSVGISYQMHGLVWLIETLTPYENLLFGVIAGPLSMEKELLKHWEKPSVKITYSIHQEILQPLNLLG